MFSWRIPLSENGCANSYSVGMLIKMLKKMAAFVSRKYQDEIFRRIVPGMYGEVIEGANDEQSAAGALRAEGIFWKGQDKTT